MSDTQPQTAPAGPFVPAEVIDHAGTMTRAQADCCTFGVVKVDDAGRVQLYNRYESELSNIPTAATEGRNFFTDVNPNANNPLFYGLFKRGVAADSLDQSFDYTFTYDGYPTPANVRLYRDPASKTNWIFVRKAA